MYFAEKTVNAVIVEILKAPQSVEIFFKQMCLLFPLQNVFVLKHRYVAKVSLSFCCLSLILIYGLYLARNLQIGVRPRLLTFPLTKHQLQAQT
jgi:hypothetical protein